MTSIIIALLLTAVVCLIVGAWLESQRVKQSPSKDAATSFSCPDWTTADVQHLQKFLTTPIGITFMQRLRAKEAALGLINAKEQVHTSHASGRTCGFGDALNTIMSLASDEMFQKLSGATAVQVAKTPPVGSEFDDAALIAKYSP
jgi:hypothetical protein